MGNPGANLEVCILGTAGLMPVPGRALISVLVRREGEIFLFDCGECAQIGMRRLNIHWKNLSGIFLTHIHADHVTGLPGILMLSSQADRTEPLPIYGPPGTKDFIESMRKTLPMHIRYSIAVHEATMLSVIHHGDGYGIRSFPLSHSKECLAYSLVEDGRPGVFFPEKAAKLNVPRGPMWSRLQSGTPVLTADGQTVYPSDVMGESRKGRKFSFVTDTVAVAGLSEFVRESDLLICEGMYSNKLVDIAAKRKHLTASQAAEIARNGKVDQLGLIHYSPDISNEGLEVLLGEARTLFPNSFLTTDLQQIWIPNHN
jgi:ribonuclease Z